ncbi:hypothetical protein Tco_0891518 [Tanacetum coccineum]|uniref:Uncharacterized protein n=1 Tax=Tanacetum coccineum TaxID=301880 RepID=A0ABQ5C3H9_9ASTR
MEYLYKKFRHHHHHYHRVDEMACLDDEKMKKIRNDVPCHDHFEVVEFILGQEDGSWEPYYEFLNPETKNVCREHTTSKVEMAQPFGPQRFMYLKNVRSFRISVLHLIRKNTMHGEHLPELSKSLVEDVDEFQCGEGDEVSNWTSSGVIGERSIEDEEVSLIDGVLEGALGALGDDSRSVGDGEMEALVDAIDIDSDEDVFSWVSIRRVRKHGYTEDLGLDISRTLASFDEKSKQDFIVLRPQQYNMWSQDKRKMIPMSSSPKAHFLYEILHYFMSWLNSLGENLIWIEGDPFDFNGTVYLTRSNS